MDDLTELQSRVAAAQERLQQNAEEERRYGLRLNDIVAIVEGSLSRQREDVERLENEVTGLRNEVGSLQATVGRMSAERDEAKTALIQAHAALSAAQTRLGQREVHNEQLRRMLLELLAAIESHKGSAVPDVMRRLEGGIKNLMQEDAAIAAAPAVEAAAEAAPAAAPDMEEEVVEDEVAEIAAAPEPAPAPIPATTGRVAAPARGRILTVVATPAKKVETAGQLALAPEPEPEPEADAIQAAEAEAAVDEEFEEAAVEEAVAEAEPEEIADIAMSEAGAIVADPDEADASEAASAPAAEAATAAPSQKEQELVNALLDAEKRLMEAEALAGAANANSPVAEIIRRISQRTREISDPGAPQA
jgi:hypothetical protein